MRIGKRLIFISYRRADTDALAGRLKDRMASALRDWDVFVDVDAIAPGVDFKRRIDETLPRASVFVPLIGEQWIGKHGERLRDPDDLVRYEIKLALAGGLRIVPVVVNGARMPSARDLPDDIAALASRNAIELRHSRFDDDFANLIRALTGRRGLSLWHRHYLAGLVRHSVLGGFSGAALSIAALVAHFEMTGASASDRCRPGRRDAANPAMRNSRRRYLALGGDAISLELHVELFDFLRLRLRVLGPFFDRGQRDDRRAIGGAIAVELHVVGLEAGADRRIHCVDHRGLWHFRRQERINQAGNFLLMP